MTRHTYKSKMALLPKLVITVIIAALVLCGGILAFSYDTFASPIAHAKAAQNDAANSNGFAGGDGSENNPFLIATAAQLDNVRNYSVVYDDTLDLFLSGGYFRVTADIDLTDYLAPNGGGYQQENWGDKGWMPIDIAESTFDGGGFCISGLWCNRSDQNRVGLFGEATGAYIKNVRLLLSDKGIIGRTMCGGIVGIINTQSANKQSAKISNCKVSGNVTAALSHTPNKLYFPSGQAGLIAGSAQHSEIEGCEADGTVTGLVYLGGIAGSVDAANVYNSIFRGRIVTTAPDTWRIICAGGIAGRSLGDSIFRNCFYPGVAGLDERIAGITGFNGWIGTDFEASPMTPPEIYDCYYNADVVCSPVTYAEPDDKWDKNCGDTTCDHTACDGREYQVFAVIENSRGLTAAEMKNKNSFAGWDFETVWGFDKDGNLVLRVFGQAYTPPSLTWLWITLGSISGAGLLAAVFVIIYKCKKPVYITETVTQTVEIPPSPLALPDTLTAREKEIAELIVTGNNTKEMLDALFISPNTLKRHIRNLFEKTGAVSQKDFILKYALGIKSPPPSTDL